MKEKRVSIKVSDATFRWIRREQNRLFEEQGNAPTQDEIVSTLIERSKAASGDTENIYNSAGAEIGTIGTKARDNPWYSLIDEILSSGYEPAITAITNGIRQAVILRNARNRNAPADQDDDLTALLERARAVLQSDSTTEEKTEEHRRQARGRTTGGGKRRAG